MILYYQKNVTGQADRLRSHGFESGGFGWLGFGEEWAPWAEGAAVISWVDVGGVSGMIGVL